MYIRNPMGSQKRQNHQKSTLSLNSPRLKTPIYKFLTVLVTEHFLAFFDVCSCNIHFTSTNNCISGLHKRALSLVYNDFSSSFSELLEKDKSVTIHHHNLKSLVYLK